jgi:hypothetical protein
MAQPHKPVDGSGTTSKLSTGFVVRPKLFAFGAACTVRRRTGFAAAKGLREKEKMRFSTESPVLY